MEGTNEKLRQAILDFVKNNPNRDSVDICIEFAPLRADITGNHIQALVKEGYLKRGDHGYEIIK